MTTDIVQRLRDGLEAGAVDMADIMDAADEIVRLRMTDAEREALSWSLTRSDIEAKEAHAAADRGYKMPECRRWAENHAKRSATLRGLLERLA